MPEKLIFMHTLLNIILFCIYTYGLGYSLTRFLNSRSFESFVLRIGIGLGSIIPLALIFNLLRIPIDWKIFLIFSLFFPILDFFKKKRSIKPLPDEPHEKASPKILALLLVLFLFNFWVYIGGSFQYPWLEDDDPWRYAAAAKYVSVEKNVRVPSGELQYINPYPPGYAIVLGLLHQTHPSLYWTTKFFNSFIISLSFLFFFYFVKEFTKNPKKALYATFFLSSIPCYLSHFIWSHALIITLFIPAFYLILKIKKDPRFILSAVILISGIFLTQPTQSIKFFILVALLAFSFSIIEKRIWYKPFLIMVSALFLAFLLWWMPALSQAQRGQLTFQEGGTVKDLTTIGKVSQFTKKLFDPKAGTATRAYTVSDFVETPKNNLINNPLGVGPVFCLFILYGIVLSLLNFKKEGEGGKTYFLTTLCWFIFTFLGVNSVTFHLPIGLFAFRFWMLFAIPASLLAAEGFYRLISILKYRGMQGVAPLFLLISIMTTSGHAKVRVNTSVWPWGVLWESFDELAGYTWMRYHLPANTKVFSFTDNFFVIGHDMRADFWSKEYKKAFNQAIRLSTNQLARTLKEHNFEYMVIDQRTIKKYGRDVITPKIEEWQEGKYFQLISQNRNAFWIFKIL